MTDLWTNRSTAANFSYPSSAAAVVFGPAVAGSLASLIFDSVRAAFHLSRNRRPAKAKSPAG